jgi:Tol biopolymer transport system component
MERISHYRLVARLGKGAMGEVWRAVDERLGRPVALKLLPKGRASQTNMQARLLREAQAASALNHPGIVTVHDVGAWHGQIFMVMELVDGEPFSQLARHGVSVVEALRLVADAADALAAAHEREILHRDVKSDNLMRTRDGRVKVLDFGLAKLRAQPTPEESAAATASVQSMKDMAAVAETLHPLEDDAPPETFPPLSTGSAPSTGSEPSSSLTLQGALVGTPVYMAPEQTGGTPGDARSEVWSLGVVLYELLAGKRPFERASIPEVLEAIRTQPLVPPSQAAPGRAIPQRVDAVVMKALDRNRAARYADMRTFAASLRQARRRIAGGHTGSETALHGGGHRLLIGLTGATLLIAAVGVYLWLGRRARVADKPGPSVTVSGTRRITFDTGCEEYPSFTPDGRSLVYDGLAEGDYEMLALDLASGTSRRLTREAGWDYGGAISPDGKLISYVHVSDEGREVRVVPIAGDGNGGSRKLGMSAAGFPSWSRDGAVLAGDGDRVVRWGLQKGARQTVVAQLAAGTMVRYVGAFDNGDMAALWQPSHASNEVVVGELPRGGPPRIVEAKLPLDSIGLAIAPTEHAYFYGRHRATANELVRRGFGEDAETVGGGLTPSSGISVSPDGKRLAYSTCRESGVIVRLRPGKPLEELMPRGAWRDVWPAPVDDHRVAFQSDRAGAVQVWMLDLKTREVRAVAAAPSSHPAVSPDGKWIAYAGGAEPGIHVAPVAAGGETRRVTDDPTDGEPEFAFDGKTVIFERTHPGEGARVYAVARTGGAVRPLSPVGALSPAASPTEDRVVFVQPGPSGRVVMTTTIAGGGARVLSDKIATGDWLNPRFSRDGKKLLIVRKTTDVVEVDVATGESKVVYKATLEGIGEATWATDGDGLIASVELWDGDLWLADGTFQ